MKGSLAFVLIIGALLPCSLMQCHQDSHTAMRGLADTVGFAHLEGQMDSVMARIERLNQGDLKDSQQAKGTTWRAAVCPHDDYTYAGWLYPAVLKYIRAHTVIIFGVAVTPSLLDC